MLTNPTHARTKTNDALSDCVQEAIRLPGSIQPHGALLVLTEPDLQVLQASGNAASLLGVSGALVGQRLTGPVAAAIHAYLDKVTERATFLRTVPLESPTAAAVHVIAHRTAGGLIAELETVPGTEDGSRSPLELHPVIDRLSAALETAETIAESSQIVAESIRELIHFDRVLVYQFDEHWNGMVVGEDGNGRLPTLLHHRFPADDIPAQARELYRLNRVRIIPDASYQPQPIAPQLNPVTGQPLDMTHCTLRSVSPVHVEYMQNMETAASMSVSILHHGQLWGLIACHHRQPKHVSFPLRAICDHVSRIFALRLSAIVPAGEYQRRIAVRSAFARLLAVMADRGDFAVALAEHPDELLSLTHAQGAAILTEESCHLLGRTPSEEQVRALGDWLFDQVRQDVFSTDALPEQYATAAAYTDSASGLLAAAVSKIHPSYVLWFRPEVVQTINWGGNPHKVGSNGDPARLHPRRSFETWREMVRQKSLPWNPSELEGAAELRHAIVEVVLRKAEEVGELNIELSRSNRELEAFSYSVSHDLRAPLRHIVGYAEMIRESGADRLTEAEQRCLDVIIESSEYAGKLVEKLLEYSRLGRAELQTTRIDLSKLVRELQADVMRDAGQRQVHWQIAELPVVHADLMMLRMALRDLLANAVKYTRGREETRIEVGSRTEGNRLVVWVRDNGVGFDMQYADKLFGVFQRLHRWEDYEGTGIGLANVRRVIERHGGNVWAEGQEGAGATFYFALPIEGGT